MVAKYPLKAMSRETYESARNNFVLSITTQKAIIQQFISEHYPNVLLKSY